MTAPLAILISAPLAALTLIGVVGRINAARRRAQAQREAVERRLGLGG